MNIWDMLAGVFSGICASLGLGGGGIMLLYLVIIAGNEQLKSQGINLLFFIPCAITALIFHQKHNLIKWKTAVWLSAGGLVGVLAGTFLADLIGNDILGKLFGGFLLFLGIRELFSKSKKKAPSEEDKKEKI